MLAREDAAGDKRLVAYYPLRARRRQPERESAARAPVGGPARVHGAGGLCAARRAAADAERQAGPQGAAGAGRRGLRGARLRSAGRRDRERLARIWAEVLGLERVGRHDNFFELGGHSLLAMRLVARVASTFDVKINVVTFFQAPTLRELAACLSSTEAPKEAWGIVQI